MNKLIKLDSDISIKRGLIIGLIIILPYFLSKGLENTLEIFLLINICTVLFSFIGIIKIAFYYKYNRREKDIIAIYIKYISISGIAILNTLSYFNVGSSYFIEKDVPYMCDYRIITNVIINIIIIYLYTSKSKKVMKHIYIIFISILSFTIFCTVLNKFVIEYILTNNNYMISIILSILNIVTIVVVLYLILQRSIESNDVFVKMFFVAFLFVFANKFYILFAKYINTNLRLGAGIISLIISILPLIAFIKYFKNNIEQQILQSNNMIKLENDFNKFKKLAENKNTSITNENLIDEKFKNEIFSNISHELRTPINVIFSALQVLELYKGNEDFKEIFYNKYMNIIKQNCYRLLRLINNVIDIGKIDSGYYKLNMGCHDIVKIVEDITLSVVAYSENKGINVIFDTNEEEIFTSCDPDKFERIILNLLSNAIKFTEQNGTISVNVALVDDKVTISVKDTGTGIPKEKLDVIFERYKQAGQDIIRENEGSGIGLSLVKSLVELQGGKIQVSSEEGQGTEFVITLPINDEPTIEVENLMENREQANIQRINIEFSDIYQ